MKSRKSHHGEFVLPDKETQITPPERPPFLKLVGCFSVLVLQLIRSSERDFVQTDILDRCPDNGEATGLRREHVNLIGALPHIAEETFNGIGCLKVSMHARGKIVERQEMLFILYQASNRFRIPLSILRFKGSQVDQRFLLAGLFPDANQLSLNLSTLSPGNSVEHIALFMHQTSLARRRRKEFFHRSNQALMTIGDDDIYLGCSSPSQILQEAYPSILTFLRTRTQSQNLFIAAQINS